MPKKKQKKVDIPLAKPEPMDGDDREIAMLWDKIMAHAPNPFAPVQHPTMYVHASASIPSGPVTGAVIVPVPPPGVHVWTMSAASTVELSPAASPLNTRGGAGSAAAGNPSASTSGSPAGSPERYGASSAHGSSKPTLQQQQISGSAIDAKVTASTLPAAPPIAPIRNVPQTGRQVCRTLSNESSLLHAEAKQREASELTNDLVDAISNETKQLSGLKAALNSDVADLERQKNDEDAHHSTRLVEQQQEFDTARYRLEDELQVLHDDRPRVEALLRHEKETKEGIRARGERLNEMAVDHAAAVKELTASLLLKRQRLETTMTNKMKRTTEEMASLTADQHQARRERAEQERARLTGELAAAEKQSRILAARSRRLTTTTDMLRRDVALESERHTFLSAKNAALARSLQQLVDNLEGLEKKFASEGQGGTNDDDAPQAPNSGRVHHVAALADDPSQLGAVVDQQYEVILQLRRDLVAIKAEIADAETKLKKRQLAVMEGPSTAPFAVTSSALSIRDRASTTSNALVLAGTTDAPFVEEYRSKVRSVFMQAVHDVEKGFQSASRSVEDVEDAERQQLLEYVVRRINANIVAPSTFAV